MRNLLSFLLSSCSYYLFRLSFFFYIFYIINLTNIWVQGLELGRGGKGRLLLRDARPAARVHGIAAGRGVAPLPLLDRHGCKRKERKKKQEGK
jgi:hypothetical protein